MFVCSMNIIQKWVVSTLTEFTKRID
jgi:hypothetical protein